MLSAAYRIVLALAFYLPLEDFLLKWLPVSDFVYLALRQLPDLLTLVAVALVLAARLADGQRLRLIGHGVEWALLILLATAAVAVGLNDASPMAAFLNLKALLRYVLITYVLVNVPIETERVRSLVAVVLAAVGIQIGIACLQLVGGEQVVRFFLPQSTEASFAGLTLHFTATWEAARGRVFGTMGQTVGFAGFMLVGLAIWLTTERDRRVWYWLGVAVFGLFIYLSGSRAALFTGFMIVLLHQYLVGRASLIMLVGGLVAGASISAVALAGVDLTETQVFSVFTERYLEIAAEQRLGIVLRVLPEFVTDVSASRILFGFSADPAVIEEFIARMFNAPAVLIREVGIIEDVYWGALALYYGVVGFLALVYVIVRSGWIMMKMRTLNEGEITTVELATVSLLLLVAAVPLNMTNQAFEVRQFSFYLWASLGLAIAFRPESPGSHGLS